MRDRPPPGRRLPPDRRRERRPVRRQPVPPECERQRQSGRPAYLEDIVDKSQNPNPKSQGPRRHEGRPNATRGVWDPAEAGPTNRVLRAGPASAGPCVGIGGWGLGVDWLPTELNREARRGAVEAISQQIGLGGRAVADAAAHTDRLGESRRDVRLWLDDEKVIASNEARPERLWLLSGRRRARRRRSLRSRIGHAAPDVA